MSMMSRHVHARYVLILLSISPISTTHTVHVGAEDPGEKGYTKHGMRLLDAGR